MQSQSVHLISINLQGSISNLNFHQPSFISPLAHVSFKNQPKWPLGRPLQKRQMDLRAQSIKKKRKRKKGWAHQLRLCVCIHDFLVTRLTDAGLCNEHNYNNFKSIFFPVFFPSPVMQKSILCLISHLSTKLSIFCVWKRFGVLSGSYVIECTPFNTIIIWLWITECSTTYTLSLLYRSFQNVPKKSKFLKYCGSSLLQQYSFLLPDWFLAESPVILDDHGWLDSAQSS